MFHKQSLNSFMSIMFYSQINVHNKVGVRLKYYGLIKKGLIGQSKT